MESSVACLISVCARARLSGTLWLLRTREMGCRQNGSVCRVELGARWFCSVQAETSIHEMLSGASYSGVVAWVALRSLAGQYHRRRMMCSNRDPSDSGKPCDSRAKTAWSRHAHSATQFRIRHAVCTSETHSCASVSVANRATREWACSVPSIDTAIRRRSRARLQLCANRTTEYLRLLKTPLKFTNPRES